MLCKKIATSSAFPILEKPDASAFRGVITKNHIHRLWAFTDIRNIRSILEQGALLSLNELSKRGIAVVRNDMLRLDDKLDYLNTSLTLPNYRLLDAFLRRYSQENRNFCLLELDPCLIYKKETLFSPVNLAASVARKYTGPTLKHFQDILAVNHNSDDARINLLLNIAANIQAEVVVKDYIPVEVVNKIYFRKEIKISEQTQILLDKYQLKTEVAPYWFTESQAKRYLIGEEIRKYYPYGFSLFLEEFAKIDDSWPETIEKLVNAAASGNKAAELVLKMFLEDSAQYSFIKDVEPKIAEDISKGEIPDYFIKNCPQGLSPLRATFEYLFSDGVNNIGLNNENVAYFLREHDVREMNPALYEQLMSPYVLKWKKKVSEEYNARVAAGSENPEFAKSIQAWMQIDIALSESDINEEI